MTGKHNKAGFTLAELLMAVLVMAVLVTMAVPIYDRAIEKSRVAEVGINLKRLNEAKLRAMDTYNITNYTTGALTLGKLDISLAQSSDFSYRLLPSGFVNSVCAVRSRGPNMGTSFLFLGEEGMETCRCGASNQVAGDVCTDYCEEGRHFFCRNPLGKSSCTDAYGLAKSYTAVSSSFCNNN